MDFHDYQQATMKQLVDPENHNLPYYALGLTGEAGEVADKIKKMIRDDKGELTMERKDGIIKELGDVLWYLSQMTNALNVSLEDVAKANIQKLDDRKIRNVKHGDGDNR